MAQVSYEDLMKSFKKKENSTNKNYAVKWFGLKDKESAIVRIMHHSVKDMDILDVHECQINGKQTKVACLRSSVDIDESLSYEESIKKCPLCEAKIPLQRKFYVHLIQYDKDERGEIVATPKMWERNAFRRTFEEFASKFNDYGDLTQHIFKITRDGEKQQTSYKINYMPEAMYPESIYKKDESLFEGVTALKSLVRNYDYNKQQELILNNFTMEYKKTDEPTYDASQIEPYGTNTQTTNGPAPVEPQQGQQENYYNPVEMKYENTAQNMSFDPNRQPAFQYNQQQEQAPTHLEDAIPTPQATYVRPQEESKPPWEDSSGDDSAPFDRPTRN